MPLPTAKFPGAIAGPADLLLLANTTPSLAGSPPTLLAGITAAVTTITLTAGTGAQLPADSFEVSIDDEIIFVGSRSADTLNSCVRAKEGTTAASHSAAAVVLNNITALSHNQLAAELNAIETQLGAGVFAALYRLIQIVDLVTGTSYSPTPGARALYVECIGGGGSGGGAANASSNCSCGSGGAGGAYSAAWLTGSIKTTYTVQVGAGGAVPGAALPGNNGTDTTFDSPTSVCTAKAGAGGPNVVSAGTSSVIGPGGAGGASASGVGDIKFDGCDGGPLWRISGTIGISGSGGSAPIGGGALMGLTSSNNGSPGKKYGGGGNGALALTGGPFAGGAGAAGLIRVWEFA
jgi:hypothetical protein